ncbi:hypothetical protein [Sinorhizobium meliloti]|uniref:hypothetical protein n=1 Tax=Rhizobium meliloti TaxID=382 RepID=UPI000FD85A18|nr:hypothetical protein [Sinorhizobium meliloti]RVL25717.1 hypothetical protein CN144_25950 [Sinorhizobium meliloti]
MTDEPQTLPEPPPPPPPGQVVKAYYYGGYIELIVIYTGTTELQAFTLTADDHYGDSDAWRAEYERALAAGEITLEPPPPIPEPLPVEP